MKKLMVLVLSVSLITGLSAATIAAAQKKPAAKKPVKKVVKPAPKAKVSPVVKPVPMPVPVAEPSPVASAETAPLPTEPAAPAKQKVKVREGAGLLLGLNAGYDAGIPGISADLDYDITNLGAAGVRIRTGIGFASGADQTPEQAPVKVINLKLGALVNLTDIFVAPQQKLSYYIGGAYLFPVKVNDAAAGKWGIEAYVGLNYVLADVATFNMQAGYSGIKYSDSEPSLKGLNFKLGTATAF